MCSGQAAPQTFLGQAATLRPCRNLAAWVLRGGPGRPSIRWWCGRLKDELCDGASQPSVRALMSAFPHHSLGSGRSALGQTQPFSSAAREPEVSSNAARVVATSPAPPSMRLGNYRAWTPVVGAVLAQDRSQMPHSFINETADPTSRCAGSTGQPGWNNGTLRGHRRSVCRATVAVRTPRCRSPHPS